MVLCKLLVSKKVILLLIISISLKAQWVKLPDPQINFPNSPFNYTLSKILPVADGKILYINNHFYSGSSGSNYNIYESVDDLNSTIQKYSITGQGASINGFAYHKDSNFVFLSSLTGINRLYYTKNDFINNNYISYCGIGGPNSPFKSYDLTNSFIYITTQQYSTDTFRVSKISTSNITQPFCTKLPIYNGLVNSIKFINDSTGNILCNYKSNTSKQVLLKTIDYGATWTEIMVDSIVATKNFHFPSVDIGYVLKSDGSVLKTNNGGNTWATIYTNTQLNCIQFTSDSIGYIGGSSGFLIKTIDGGNSWNTELSNTNFSILSLYAFDNDVVYFKDSTMNIYKNKPLKLLPVSPIHVTINTNPSQIAICPGTPINLTANGAYSYTWSANAGGVQSPVVTVSPQINTTYTVIGTNNTGSYTDTQTVAITVFPVPQIIATPQIAEICQDSGDSITFTGSNAIYYFWSTDFGFVNEPTLTVNSNISQTYTLGGYDTNYCYSSVEVQLNVIYCPDLMVYPNPSSTTLIIKSISAPIIKLSIDNLLGQNYYNSLFDKKNNLQLDVSNLNEGLYFIIITTENSKIKRKILIKH